MQRRSGEALQRDHYRGRSKPSVTPTDVGTVGDFEQALAESDVEAIRLTGDIALSSGLNVNRELTLDLNGHSLTGDFNAPLLTVDGENAKLTLEGGNAQNRSNVAVAKNGGEIVVENGEYTSTNFDVFRAQPLGKITVNGGTITGSEGAVVCYGKGTKDGEAGCFGTVVINGGNLIGTDNFAVSTNGSTGMGHNSITINGGHLEGNIKSAGYEAIGVYLPNNDTFVMNGGEIIANGGTGICQRGGNATINGGSITATNVDKNGNVVADGWIGDKKTVMTGCSAVIYHRVSGYSGYTDGMRLTVTNGTITGIDHSIQVLSDETEPQVFVTGGTFTPAYPEPTPNEEPATT